MAVSTTPWMGTVTLTSKNTAYSLATLLAGLANSIKPLLSSVPKCQFIAIQANPNNNTGAKYYIGNSVVSSTNYGTMIFANQVWPIYSMDSNLIRLDQIYLMCDTDAETMNIVFLTR